MANYRRMWWVMGSAFWLLIPNRAGAQSLTWDDFLDRITDQQSENYTQLYDFYDDLCYLHEHPIHINSATTEVLNQLPFLNAQQIEEIEAYVYSYGPIMSVGELNLVPYLDYDTRQLLALFITFETDKKRTNSKLSFNNLKKYGKNEILLKTDIPFYSLNEKYLGSSMQHSIRYHYQYNNKLEWGFTAEKDSGEPFFQNVDKGFDNYNYYLIIRNLGLLKTLAIGDYRLRYGQGLVLNSQFSLGKSAMLSQLNTYTRNTITKHSSMSESGYFQGAAAQFIYNNWNLDTFVSYKLEDATLTKDSLISTLITDGYHRTITEINKKNNISNLLIGTHLSWKKNDFNVGFTTTYTLFNHKFITYPVTHYKHYYPQGNKFWNGSLDYSYISYRWTVSGETAIDGKGSLATINSIQFRPSSHIQLNLVQRYYSKSYNSIYGQAFGESSNVKNENGLYLGTVYKPLSRLKLSAYVDIYEFPWLRYQVAAKHSKGIDVLGQVQYVTSSKVEWLMKYRMKLKQQNLKNPLNNKQIALANRITQTARIQAKYQLGFLLMNTQINYAQYNLANYKPDRGYGLSQQLMYKCKRPALQLSIQGTYFHTDSYDARIYSYESGLLYSFSFPSYYGHGYRFSSVFRYDINKQWMIQLKYGHTQYFTSSQTKKDNLQVQLRCKI